jgi:hypothetical protein
MLWMPLHSAFLVGLPVILESVLGLFVVAELQEHDLVRQDGADDLKLDS